MLRFLGHLKVKAKLMRKKILILAVHLLKIVLIHRYQRRQRYKRSSQEYLTSPVLLRRQLRNSNNHQLPPLSHLPPIAQSQPQHPPLLSLRELPLGKISTDSNMKDGPRSTAQPTIPFSGTRTHLSGLSSALPILSTMLPRLNLSAARFSALSALRKESCLLRHGSLIGKNGTAQLGISSSTSRNRMDKPGIQLPSKIWRS